MPFLEYLEQNDLSIGQFIKGIWFVRRGTHSYSGDLQDNVMFLCYFVFLIFDPGGGFAGQLSDYRNSLLAQYVAKIKQRALQIYREFRTIHTGEASYFKKKEGISSYVPATYQTLSYTFLVTVLLFLYRYYFPYFIHE